MTTAADIAYLHGRLFGMGFARVSVYCHVRDPGPDRDCMIIAERGGFRVAYMRSDGAGLARDMGGALREISCPCLLIVRLGEAYRFAAPDLGGGGEIVSTRGGDGRLDDLLGWFAGLPDDVWDDPWEVGAGLVGRITLMERERIADG